MTRKKERNRTGNKGQTMEILNFLALVVIIIGVIFLMRSVGLSQSLESGQAASRYHKSTSFHSAVNAFISTTNSDSGRNMLELMALVSNFNQKVLRLGPPGNKVTVNATLQFKQKLDKLLGENNWHLTIPIAKKSKIQVIMVVDASRSMCDDINNIQNELPYMIQNIEAQGKDVKVEVYILPGGGNCDSANFDDITCDNFPSSDILECEPIKNLDCSLAGSNEEDWGNGLKCVIESEANKWPDNAVLLGVPLSDEMPAGCECGSDSCDNYRSTGVCWSGSYMGSDSGCTTQQESLDNGITAAQGIGMVLFPLQANPCATPSVCSSGKVYTCANRPILKQYMEEAADKTGGERYVIDDASKASKIIKNLVSSQQGQKISPIEMGSKPPFKGKTTYRIPLPVIQGGVVMAKLDWWS